MNAHRGKITMAVVAASLGVVALIAARDGQKGAAAPAATHPSAFAWVHPSALPAGWSAKRLPRSPAWLAAPTGWRFSHGDPGTRTAILEGPGGEIAGYLNATPRQGDETLANWSEFRVEHNEEEEELDVTLEAAASGLRFPGGRGSCVIDSYRTTSGHRYREVACIVAGRSATTVIVGAAPPALWDEEAATIERAITSFRT